MTALLVLGWLFFESMMMSREYLVKPIPTTYKGVMFRSRIEARWAVYFDYFKIEWEYEYQGFELLSGPYLPDFWLPQIENWAEVKPTKLTAIEEVKVEELVLSTGFPCLLLIGAPKARPTPVIEPIPDWMKPNDHYIKMSEKRGMRFVEGVYEVGNLFGLGRSVIWDVVIDNSYLDENRFFHSTGLGFNDDLDGFYSGVEEAVSAALSARF